MIDLTPNHQPPLTIDRGEVITLFHQLMRPHSLHRVLRLSGDPKMGKSHFLTKIFPHLARQHYGARCITLDIRNLTSSQDFLHRLAMPLEDFPHYHQTYQAWVNRSKVEVKNVFTLLTSISLRNQAGPDEAQAHLRNLLTHLERDLRTLTSTPLLVMIDALDDEYDKDPHLKSWVLNQFLPPLTQLNHLRLVLAGRQMPPATSDYSGLCLDCHLTSVQDTAAYHTYCQHQPITIDRHLIDGYILGAGYRPGFFIELLYNYIKFGGNRD